MLSAQIGVPVIASEKLLGDILNLAVKCMPSSWRPGLGLGTRKVASMGNTHREYGYELSCEEGNQRKNNLKED